MKHFYSPETGGFYIEGVHNEMPFDVIEISLEKYRELMDGQAVGKKIAYKGRKLQLVDFDIPEITWDQIRRRRDNLLTSCDWTQLTDAPLPVETQEAWRLYRQALRDITETFKKATLVVWPVSPDNAE
jgi:hypothetical protein